MLACYTVKFQRSIFCYHAGPEQKGAVVADNRNGQDYGSHLQRKRIFIESSINYTTRYTERPAGVRRGAAGGALPDLPLPPAGAVRVCGSTPSRSSDT